MPLVLWMVAGDGLLDKIENPVKIHSTLIQKITHLQSWVSFMSTTMCAGLLPISVFHISSSWCIFLLEDFSFKIGLQCNYYGN